MQRRLLILLGIVTLLAIISPALVVLGSLTLCIGDHAPMGCTQNTSALLSFSGFLFILGLFLWVITTLFGLLVVGRRGEWGWVAVIAVTGPIGATLYGLFIYDRGYEEVELLPAQAAPRPPGAVASDLFDTLDTPFATESDLSSVSPDEPAPPTTASRADGGEPANPEGGA